MNLFNADKVMNRLDVMIENAMNGKPIENGFDETKMSALETKLSHYLAMNNAKKDQLAEEKKRINELISDISHQTKTPISNILLYSQLLAESDLPETEKSCVESLLSQAEKLNFLIASLVKTSRLETGIISLVPKENPIQPILEQIWEQARPRAVHKKITFTCESTDICAVFDPKWTTEALYNIVDNAMKYTSCYGTIAITVQAYQLFCRIDVADSGIGIREEEAAKIFTRFYRSPAVNEEEGVGIGLYLAREIVSNEGGYIKVKSEPEIGSTFSIFLPIRS